MLLEARRGLLVGATLLALALCAEPLRAASECRSEPLPTLFPQDALLFHATVLEPASLYENERGAGWAIRVRVTDPVHLPGRPSVFDIALSRFSADCSLAALDQDELIDQYRAGDLVKVLAHDEGAPAGFLQTTLDRFVMVFPGVARPPVEDEFDYLKTLLDVERQATDNDRVGLLASMAPFVTTKEHYTAILKAQLNEARLRRHLKSVYSDIRKEARKRAERESRGKSR